MNKEKSNLFSTEKSDECTSEEGIDCTFLRNIKGFEHVLNASNTRPEVANLSLSELLSGFFEFYANFNFNESSVCVLSGTYQPKRRQVNHILDIVNPLEPRLNVAANVQDQTVIRFRRSCMRAYSMLQKAESNVDLVAILEKEQFTKNFRENDVIFTKPKIPRVKDLFDEK